MATVLNYEATVQRILKGDIPEVSANQQDYIMHVSDSVGTIYANLLAKMILGDVDDSVPQEMVTARVDLYDTIMGVVSQCRFGRLMNIVDGLNSIIAEQMTRTDVFSSNRVRNNVLGFIVDWWLYTTNQRSELLVTDTVDEDGYQMNEAEEVEEVESYNVVEMADKEG